MFAKRSSLFSRGGGKRWGGRGSTRQGCRGPASTQPRVRWPWGPSSAGLGECVCVWERACVSVGARQLYIAQAWVAELGPYNCTKSSSISWLPPGLGGIGVEKWRAGPGCDCRNWPAAWGWGYLISLGFLCVHRGGRRPAPKADCLSR